MIRKNFTTCLKVRLQLNAPRIINAIDPYKSLSWRSCSSKSNSYFVTTPIFYVNADPHIGHLHSLAVADALHIFHKIKGASKTIFSTGTDEHGLKIQKAAKLKNLEPRSFCDTISEQFRSLAKEFRIGNTDFIRTSEVRHYDAVKQFWKTLETNGHIYKSNYEGWYCVSDETFVSTLQTEDIVKDGVTVKVSSESGNPVEWFEEENYMFRLSSFKDQLLSWLDANIKVIEPDKFHNLVKLNIEQGLSDISVSRPASRLSWGIPVPNDASQTIYVWLDALINYLTVAGYPNSDILWPPDCHVVGKDIIKFHAIYWPAFLMAAGLKPPRKLICHSHWTVNDLKMSKSRGNVVSPFEMRDKYGAEGLRYYLLRESVPHMDGSFSELQLRRLLNNELADTYGNLLGRCAGKSVNKMQQIPTEPAESYFRAQTVSEVISLSKHLQDDVAEHYSGANFNRGIEAVMKFLRATNQFVQTEQPWVLSKDQSEKERLDFVIYVALEACRIASILLQPIIPETSFAVLTKLNVKNSQRTWEHAKFDFGSSSCEARNLSEGSAVVFRKIKE